MATEDVTDELRQILGKDFVAQRPLAQETLNVILLAEKYLRAGGLNAKQVSRWLRHRMPDEYQERGENEFYRAVRRCVERLAPEKNDVDLDDRMWHSSPYKMLSIQGPSNRPTFRINREYQQSMLLATFSGSLNVVRQPDKRQG